MPQKNALKDLSRSIVNFLALTVGLGSGVAQLAGTSTGIGQVSLAAVGISCILYLVIRFWMLYIRAKLKDLTVARDQALAERDEARVRLDEVHRAKKRELDEAGRREADEHKARTVLAEGLEWIIDHEVALYDETLEIDVTVGDDDRGDTVVESRRTVPHRKLMHRAIRPIVPSADEWTPARMSDLGFRVTSPAGAAIKSFPLVEKPHYLRVWLLFESGIEHATSWRVEYRPRGLWHPYRLDGQDQLKWSDRPPTGNGDRSALTRITFKFLFPPTRRPPSMWEDRGYGHFQPARRLEGSSQWLIAWTDDSPAGRRYVWHLRKATDQ